MDLGEGAGRGMKIGNIEHATSNTGNVQRFALTLTLSPRRGRISRSVLSQLYAGDCRLTMRKDGARLLPLPGERAGVRASVLINTNVDNFQRSEMSEQTKIKSPDHAAKDDLSAREAITYYNPMEEREADKAPLQLALIRRIFHYTKPYAAKRNWLFVLTFTRGLQLPALAWMIGRTINGPIARPGFAGHLLVCGGVFRVGAGHGGDVSFPPAVRARTGRGGRARHAPRICSAS